MVLSSRIASSTSVFPFRTLPGLDGAVFARERDGEGNRERMRFGDNVPYVVARCAELGALTIESGRLLGSSTKNGSVDSTADIGLEWAEFWLCTLDRREGEPTGFLWISHDVEGLDDTEFVRESLLRTSACAGISSSAGNLFHSSTEKSGSGERRPSGR